MKDEKKSICIKCINYEGIINGTFFPKESSCEGYCIKGVIPKNSPRIECDVCINSNIENYDYTAIKECKLFKERKNKGGRK